MTIAFSNVFNIMNWKESDKGLEVETYLVGSLSFIGNPEYGILKIEDD